MLRVILWLCLVFPGGLIVFGLALAQAPFAGLFGNLWGLAVFGLPAWWALKYLLSEASAGYRREGRS
jgi:hypothetical protein